MVTHKMLENFLKRRKQMQRATGRPELFPNPTTFCCPFKSTKPGHTLRHACNTASNLGKLYEDAYSHLAAAHPDNPAARILIARFKYLETHPDGKSLDDEGRALFLSNEWLMDEANGRGEEHGYEPLADELASLREAPDYLKLSFTNAYDDIAAKRAWCDGLPQELAAAAERAVAAEAVADAPEQAD